MDFDSDVFKDWFDRDSLDFRTAKRKIKNGEELTREDQEEILQTVYSYAKEQLKKFKRTKSTQTSITLKGISAVCSLLGKRFKTISITTGALSTDLKNEKDNYNKLISGVDITNNNRIQENFSTLIAQYDSVSNFYDILIEFMAELYSRNNSYKRDYSTPVAPDKQEELKETREQILSLSKKYIER